MSFIQVVNISLISILFTFHASSKYFIAIKFWWMRVRVINDLICNAAVFRSLHRSRCPRVVRGRAVLVSARVSGVGRGQLPHARLPAATRPALAAQSGGVLARGYAQPLPACDENLRSEVAAAFVQLCVSFLLAQCTRPSCNRLHMCREWLRTGRCSSAIFRLFFTISRRASATFSTILRFRFRRISRSATCLRRGIQAMLGNLICADGTYVKLSTCNCFEAEPMGMSGQALSDGETRKACAFIGGGKAVRFL